MARRIRWQIMITLGCTALIIALLSHLALSTTAQGDPAAGGRYREALIGAARDFDPLRANPTAAEADISALLFEGLTRIETTGIVAPSLATGWEISADSRTYTITLRPDVTWHDGDPFDADDVIWTLSWVQGNQFGGDPALTALWRDVRVTPLDDTTLRFDLPAPFAPFLSQLALPILPAHLLANATPAERDAWAQRPIGTGAYRFQSFEDDLITLERYVAYRPGVLGAAGVEPAPTPYLDVLEFQLFPALEDAHTALRRGFVDGLAYNVTAREELLLPSNASRVRAPLADYVQLSFNLRREPIAQLEVRQALAYAIDSRDIIAEALDGRGLPLVSPILPSSWAAVPSLTPYTDDEQRTRANSLLDALGWERDAAGRRLYEDEPAALTLIATNTPERSAVAQVVADHIDTLGISVTVELLAPAELATRLQAHEFDLAIHGWSDLGSDPDVYELWHSSQVDAANFAGLEDDAIDELLADGRRTTDIESRTALYADFQRRWLALAPAVMLYQPLLEQQVSASIQVLGISDNAAQSEVLFQPADRFRRIVNWYQITTRQLRTELRYERSGPR